MERTIKFILIFISVLSFLIILRFGMNLDPSSSVFKSDKADQVLVNLSYSYIAGLIFYFLVNLFPHITLKRKLKPAIDLKIVSLKEQIICYVTTFNCDTNPDINKIDLHFLQQLTKKHKILDKSYYSIMVGTSISNLDYINSTKANIFSLVKTLIEYREFLSSGQILELERIRDSKFFHLVKMGNYPNAHLVYPSNEFGAELANRLYEIIISVRKI